MNYEEILQTAKDEVARKYGHRDWAQLMCEHNPSWQNFYLNKAAILAMKKVTISNYEINFDGHIKTLLKIEDGQLIVEAAMNGYGDAIDKNKIIITNK